MSPETPIRLEFERPPIIEQAICIIFEPLPGFSIIDYGLFWNALSAEFPHVRAALPIDTTTEHFDDQQRGNLHIRLSQEISLPRAMYGNDAGELVQLQADRFLFNWAKTEGSEYPRSERLMERFGELFGRFQAYAESRCLGDIAIRQAELTNLNVLPISEFGTSFADIGEALNVDPLDLGVPFLKAETYIRNRVHRIVDEDGKPLGRLHTVIEPVRNSADNSIAYKLEFTARSAPGLGSIEAAKRFYGIARNAINGAFGATVTEKMRKKWGEGHGQ